MQSRALFWRPSFWSAAVDGLWSVIVPVAWPLTDGLSRWSPSTGGGNESGLRTLLLSAPLTPCLSPRLPIWAISPRLTWWVWACVCLRLQMCVCRWAETFCKKKKSKKRKDQLLHGFIGATYLQFLPPSDLMLSSSRVSETVRDAYFSCSSSLSVKPPWLIRINGGLDRMTESQIMAICLAQKFWGN